MKFTPVAIACRILCQSCMFTDPNERQAFFRAVSQASHMRTSMYV